MDHEASHGEPEIMRAARVGDHDAIRREIAGGADPNGVFSAGRACGCATCCEQFATPLIMAAGSGDGATVDTVRLLLSLGADPKITTNMGSPAKVAAIGLGGSFNPGGDAERLKLLIDVGSPIPRSGPDAATLMTWVTEIGDLARLEVLLSLHLPVDPMFDASAALARAAQLNQDILQASTDRSGEDPSEPSLENAIAELSGEIHRDMVARLTSGPMPHEIPLFGAARSGNGELIRQLLHAGADVRQRDSLGQTALFEAASPAAVEALAEAGVDLHATSAFGRDALRSFVEDLEQNGLPPGQGQDICRALLKVGVPLVLPAEAGRDRLYDAAFSENAVAVEFLLQAGHPVRATERGNPLHAICWHWDYGDERDDGIRRMVRALIAAGADANGRDSEGNTPLHEAMTGDGVNRVAAELLLAAGADVNAVNSRGCTPLMQHYQSLFDYECVAEFLLRHGADPMIADESGKTVIDVARRMIAGENPDWRVEQWSEKGGPPCEWKPPATPGDSEFRALEMLERAAKQRRG